MCGSCDFKSPEVNAFVVNDEIVQCAVPASAAFAQHAIDMPENVELVPDASGLEQTDGTEEGKLCVSQCFSRFITFVRL